MTKIETIKAIIKIIIRISDNGVRSNKELGRGKLLTILSNLLIF